MHALRGKSYTAVQPTVEGTQLWLVGSACAWARLLSSLLALERVYIHGSAVGLRCFASKAACMRRVALFRKLGRTAAATAAATRQNAAGEESRIHPPCAQSSSAPLVSAELADKPGDAGEHRRPTLPHRHWLAEGTVGQKRILLHKRSSLSVLLTLAAMVGDLALAPLAAASGASFREEMVATNSASTTAPATTLPNISLTTQSPRLADADATGGASALPSREQYPYFEATT